jgi:hypothetical protein
VSPAQRTQFAFALGNWRPAGATLFQANGVGEVNDTLLSLGTAPSSAWYPQAISPASFRVQFTFTMGQVQQEPKGFAVVLQNQGINALGNAYGYIGIGGRSGAIVFDPFSQADSTLTILALRDSNPTPLATASFPAVIGNTWTAWVTYDFCPNTLTLWLEQGRIVAPQGPTTPPILTLQLTNKTVVANTLFGFTASQLHATVNDIDFK